LTSTGCADIGIGIGGGLGTTGAGASAITAGAGGGTTGGGGSGNGFVSLITGGGGTGSGSGGGAFAWAGTGAIRSEGFGGSSAQTTMPPRLTVSRQAMVRQHARVMRPPPSVPAVRTGTAAEPYPGAPALSAPIGFP
jgi:hypothetical protein